MNDFLNEVAAYLATAGAGTVGTNLFIGKVPGSPDDLVVLLGLSGTFIGAQKEVASLQMPRFQVYIRAADYDDASDKLQAVRTALHGLYSTQLSHWRILRCHAEQEGGPIGEDDKGRFEFTINFVAEINAQTS